MVTGMERLEWIKDFTHFQAHCRGYLIRKDLKAVQADYEAIVRELEGSVDHLSWKGHLILKPHFTLPEDDVFTKYRRSKVQTQDCSVGSDDGREQNEASPLRSEDLLSERDEEPSLGTEGGCSESRAAQGGDAEPEGLHRGGNGETAGDSCVNLSTGNISLLHRGVQMCPVLTAVPHTPEALLQHRNTLAMELLWIQQAISSRKKYLNLKKKMEAA